MSREKRHAAWEEYSKNMRTNHRLLETGFHAGYESADELNDIQAGIIEKLTKDLETMAAGLLQMKQRLEKYERTIIGVDPALAPDSYGATISAVQVKNTDTGLWEDVPNFKNVKFQNINPAFKRSRTIQDIYTQARDRRDQRW